MSTTTIIWTGDSANAPSTINNLYGIDADTAKRLVDALNNGGASLSFEIRSDGHLWQVNTATGEAKDMGQVVPTTGQYVDGTSDPIVIGKGAAVGGDVTNTIVIGKGSAVGDYVSNSVNIGTGMGLAKGANDRIIIGSGSSAYGDDSVAIGSPASVSDSESVAIGGANASASGAHAIAIGSDASSVGAYATGVGSNSAAQAEGAVALGGSTTVTASHAVALGDDSVAGEAYTVSVGTDTVKRRIVNVGEPVASADAATKRYVDTAGRGWSPVIVGSGASIDGGNPNTQTVVGVGARSGGDKATAVGANTSATGDKSTAVGASATVSGAQSDALGASSSVSGASSVALGFGSVASDNSVVSVGSGVSTESYGKRRIVNVDDPTGDSDAATKGYVDKAVGSGSSYTLPTASASTLGGVKVGKNLTVTDDGTLNADAEPYTLPIALPTRLGGMKPGKGLAEAEDGTMSVVTATSEHFGGVKVGNGLDSILDGTLSVSPATATTIGGVKVGDGLSVTSDGTLSATGGSGSSYTLPTASATTLGGVKVGKNLSVTDDGTLNADATSPHDAGIQHKLIENLVLALTNNSTGITPTSHIQIGVENIIVGITPGNSVQLTAKLDSGATQIPVAWDVSPSTAGGVTNNMYSPYYDYMYRGPVTLTAYAYGGAKDSITVYNMTMSVTPLNPTMKVGEKISLSTTTNPGGFKGYGVTWQTSDDTIGTITSDGATATFTAAKEGTCRITATMTYAKGVTAYTTVTVTAS